MNTFYAVTEYADVQSKSPDSVRMLENTDQINSEYGHFSYSAPYLNNST